MLAPSSNLPWSRSKINRRVHRIWKLFRSTVKHNWPNRVMRVHYPRSGKLVHFFTRCATHLARRSQPNFLIPDTRGTIFLATVQQSSLLSRFLAAFANPRLRNRNEDRNATHHAFFSPLSMFSRRDDRTRIALNEAWERRPSNNFYNAKRIRT